MKGPQVQIRIIGSATVVPEAGNDTACTLLNDTCLIDTGWNAAINMKAFGCDPMAVDHLFITHCHHDHYLGLPQLLFHHAMRRSQRPDKPPLVIVGPKPDIGMVVERALQFLRRDQFPSVATMPEVIALQAGDTMEIPGFTVATAPTVHPVVGLCYRFNGVDAGPAVVITGDTAYHTPLAEHARGVDLLIHEASRGPVESNPNAKGGHSGAIDAARIARAAGVGCLALVHYLTPLREEILAAARDVFPNTIAPQPGELLDIPVR